MRYIFIVIVIVLSCSFAHGQNQRQKEIQSKSSLAIKYYNAKNYDKAIPLLLDVYRLSQNKTYYRFYIHSLVELKRFSEAEAAVQKEIRRHQIPEFFIHWGYVLKSQEKFDEADQKYQEAIKRIQPNKGSYLVAASQFISWAEYDLARQTYLKGRKVLAPEQFNYELANSYLYLRDYDNMMEEYLNLLRQNEKQLARVQSRLSSAMRLDIDNELRDKFRGMVLKRIQAEPNVTGYNRLLIWFFLQEQKFASALRQSVALDRRTGQEAIQILQLGNMAIRSQKYTEAKNAFRYLVGKGEESPYFSQSYSLDIHASYLEYINKFSGDTVKGRQLDVEMSKGLEFLGYSPATLNLISEHAHLMAFHLNDQQKAIAIIEQGLKIPALKNHESGALKIELADIYVYADDPWEATLIYSQVIDANKKHVLGDEAKLKKARLGYYTGNFDWAKAQLDVLKASTSKLTANDAMELSMLIGNNLNLDTTQIPLQMFARADLLFFRNQNEKALITLDSIAKKYPYHSLVDEILFRKANIEIEAKNYDTAAVYLEKIVSDFSYDLLADNALFKLAELYNYNLNRKIEARDLYKSMLIQHPGSVFVEESRKKYRELRKAYPEEEIIQGVEDPVTPEIENNEFN